jgi:hypothetical protein
MLDQNIIYIGVCCMPAIEDHLELEKGPVPKASTRVEFANKTVGKKVDG